MDIIKILSTLKNNLEKELIKDKINFKKNSNLFKDGYSFINEDCFELIKIIEELIKFKKIYFGGIYSKPLSNEEIEKLKDIIKKFSKNFEKILFEYFLLE